MMKKLACTSVLLVLLLAGCSHEPASAPAAKLSTKTVTAQPAPKTAAISPATTAAAPAPPVAAEPLLGPILRPARPEPQLVEQTSFQAPNSVPAN